MILKVMNRTDAVKQFFLGPRGADGISVDWSWYKKDLTLDILPVVILHRTQNGVDAVTGTLWGNTALDFLSTVEDIEVTVGEKQLLGEGYGG